MAKNRAKAADADEPKDVFTPTTGDGGEWDPAAGKYDASAAGATSREANVLVVDDAEADAKPPELAKDLDEKWKHEEVDAAQRAANAPDPSKSKPPAEPPHDRVRVANVPGDGPKVIRPTPGRHVDYFPKGWVPAQQPWAAIVCHVHDDRLVNLCTFTPEGQPVPATNVLLCQPGDPRPRGGNYCAWMEYQVGQARG